MCDKVLGKEEEQLNKYLHEKTHDFFHFLNPNEECCKCPVTPSSLRIRRSRFMLLFCHKESTNPCTESEGRKCICAVTPNEVCLDEIDVDLLHMLLVSSHIPISQKNMLESLYKQRYRVFQCWKSNKPVNFDELWTETEDIIKNIAYEMGGKMSASTWNNFLRRQKNSEPTIYSAKLSLKILEIEFETVNVTVTSMEDTTTGIHDNSNNENQDDGKQGNESGVFEGENQPQRVINLYSETLIIGDHCIFQNTGMSEASEIKINEYVQEQKKGNMNLLHRKGNVACLVNVDNESSESSIDTQRDDESKARIEWKVAGDGLDYEKMERILKMMDGLEIVAGAFAEIEFVRTGSVVIGTLFPALIVDDQSQFIKGIAKFLDTILDRCQIDISQDCIIKINIVVKKDRVISRKKSEMTTSAQMMQNQYCDYCTDKDTTLRSLLHQLKQMESTIIIATSGQITHANTCPMPLQKKNISIKTESPFKCVKCASKEIEIVSLKSKITKLEDQSKKTGVYGKMAHRRTFSDSTITSYDEFDDNKNVYDIIKDDIKNPLFSKVRCKRSCKYSDCDGIISELKEGETYRLLQKIGDWYEIVSEVPGCQSSFVLSKYIQVDDSTTDDFHSAEKIENISPQPKPVPRKSVSQLQFSTPKDLQKEKRLSLQFTEARSSIENFMRKSDFLKNKVKSLPADFETKDLFEGFVRRIKLSDSKYKDISSTCRQYVKFEGDVLAFYKERPKMIGEKAELKIELKDCIMKDKGDDDVCIELLTANGDNYLLYAEDKDSKMNLFLQISQKINEQDNAPDVEKDKDTQGGRAKPDFMKIVRMLMNFFSRRPRKESLESRGILKAEIFGSSIKEICETEKTKIPKFLQNCIAAIERSEITSDIYSKHENTVAVQTLRYQIEHENAALESSTPDVNSLTDLLLLFFEELKTPLLPFSLCSVMKQPEQKRKLLLKDRMNSLPICHKETFCFLLKHFLRLIEKYNVNIERLATTVGPALIRPRPEGEAQKEKCTWKNDDYPAKIIVLCLKEKSHFLNV
ncbi:Hypothetical predicted protein [Mytilus galloprovincialis]|uniref:Rho-GAP domain-containing protein n=1 Tax=Mytilus galloprovincialis TaxID=29158 RepID=A0A8B6FZJ9_MYTGA|nr:Hypothetical predicted protein [Mytilus galloprovincialis]